MYDPTNPYGTPPVGMVPPGQGAVPAPQQPMSAFGQLAYSPDMAAVGQAINNIAAMRRGAAPQTSPMQAAAEQRRRNEILQQSRYRQIEAKRERQDRQRLLEERAAMAREQHAANMDPAYEYKALREQFPDQFNDMTFAEFQQMGLRPADRTSVQKNMQLWDEMNPNATPAERNVALATFARPTGVYNLGGGQMTPYNPLLGARDALVTADTAISREAAEAGATAGASKRAATLEEQAAAVRTTAAGLPVMDAQLTRNNEIIKDIDENGKYAGTGVLSGYVNRLFDPEIAALEAEGVYNTLMNLQITRLTPITEKEIELVSKMWASAFRNGKVNVGLLQEANRRIRVMKAQAEEAIDYYNKDDVTLPDGRVKGYGSMEGFQMGDIEMESPDGTIRRK